MSENAFILRTESFVPRSISLLTMYKDISYNKKSKKLTIIGTLLKRKGIYRYDLDLNEEGQSARINTEMIDNLDNENSKLRILAEFNTLQLEQALEFLESKLNDLKNAKGNNNKIKPLEYELSIITNSTDQLLLWFEEKGMKLPEAAAEYQEIKEEMSEPV